MADVTDAERRSELGQQFRVDSIRMSAAAKSGHPTSAMSAADLLAVLVDGYLRYDFDAPKSPANDRLIFSKGHASTLLYSIYLAAGVISDEELLSYRKLGSRLEGHPTPVLPWVDVATGSLGQGLPIGVGTALAAKRPRPRRRPHLGSLRRQRDGRGLDVGGVRARGPLRARQPDRDPRRQPARASGARRWSAGISTSTSTRARAFGWHAIAIDGHDVEEIDRAFTEALATTGKADASSSLARSRAKESRPSRTRAVLH